MEMVDRQVNRIVCHHVYSCQNYLVETMETVLPIRDLLERVTLFFSFLGTSAEMVGSFFFPSASFEQQVHVVPQHCTSSRQEEHRRQSPSCLSTIGWQSFVPLTSLDSSQEEQPLVAQQQSLDMGGWTRQVLHVFYLFLLLNNDIFLLFYLLSLLPCFSLSSLLMHHSLDIISNTKSVHGSVLIRGDP